MDAMKWEYQEVRVNTAEAQIADTLNREGKESWELVAFWKGHNRWDSHALMKRRLKQMPPGRTCDECAKQLVECPMIPKRDRPRSYRPDGSPACNDFKPMEDKK